MFHELDVLIKSKILGISHYGSRKFSRMLQLSSLRENNILAHLFATKLKAASDLRVGRDSEQEALMKN